MQEKYKRKKAKKYTSYVTAIRPTAHSLAEFYFNKIPVKTGWLRPDSLAILLSLANISAGSRTLVVDGTGGLIAGPFLMQLQLCLLHHRHVDALILHKRHTACGKKNRKCLMQRKIQHLHFGLSSVPMIAASIRNASPKGLGRA